MIPLVNTLAHIQILYYGEKGGLKVIIDLPNAWEHRWRHFINREVSGDFVEGALFGVLQNCRWLPGYGAGAVKGIGSTQEGTHHEVDHLIKEEAGYSGVELGTKPEIDL